MLKLKNFFLSLSLAIFLIPFSNLFADDESINETLKLIQKDIKTLEKAVYSNNQDQEQTSNSNLMNQSSEEVLTRHLLKLSEIENQFQELTNKFEEINFKLDKLSSRL